MYTLYDLYNLYNLYILSWTCQKVGGMTREKMRELGCFWLFYLLCPWRGMRCGIYRIKCIIFIYILYQKFSNLWDVPSKLHYVGPSKLIYPFHKILHLMVPHKSIIHPNFLKCYP